MTRSQIGTLVPYRLATNKAPLSHTLGPPDFYPLTSVRVCVNWHNYASSMCVSVSAPKAHICPPPSSPVPVPPTHRPAGLTTTASYCPLLLPARMHDCPKLPPYCP